MPSPTIELLYFGGCPHAEAARDLVERLAGEESVDAALHVVEITTLEDAERLRFLGSPTVRVNGRDVEPGADDRDAYALGCRVYRTDAGLQGVPAEAWIRDALRLSRSHG